MDYCKGHIQMNNGLGKRAYAHNHYGISSFYVFYSVLLTTLTRHVSQSMFLRVLIHPQRYRLGTIRSKMADQNVAECQVGRQYIARTFSFCRAYQAYPLSALIGCPVKGVITVFEWG